MKIINNALLEDLKAGTPLKLNLGSGAVKKEGFYSVDHIQLGSTDVIADLNMPLSQIPDDSTTYIYSRHVLEHVSNLLLLMEEIYRISRPDATIEIIVPHFSNVFGYSDPTHVRFFGLYSMNYFMEPAQQPSVRKVPAYYARTKFRNLQVSIEFYNQGLIDRFFSRTMSKIVNRNFQSQEFYERRICQLFHAWQVRYKMQPDKNQSLHQAT